MISVITPAFSEDNDIIERNILSVQNQICDQTIFHYVIFDGVKRKNYFLKKFSQFKNLFISEVKLNHDDYGDYIRRIGTKLALKNNFKAITFLDADNYLEDYHIKNIIRIQRNKNKNIIISSRKILDSKNVLVKNNEIKLFEGDMAHQLKYFDTNMITLFNEKINCGLLWGRYPKEMSIIGDRIISKFLTNNFKNEIAFNNSKSVIYYQTKIPKSKVKKFKNWYSRNYKYAKTKFVKNFGFDLIL